MGDVTVENTDEKAVRAQVSSGQRIREVFDFLKNERVNNEFIFTAEHAQQLRQKTGITTAHAYAVLGRLEAKGFITREKLEAGKGVLITFVNRKSPARSRNGQDSNAANSHSIKGLRARVRAEIEQLQEALADKQKFLDQLTSYAEITKEEK